MESTYTMEREALHAEISERLSTKPGPMKVLLEFLDTAADIGDVMYRLTEHDEFDSTTEILEDIQRSLVKAERFLREEAFADLSQAKREWGEYFKFEAPLPDDITISYEASVPQFSFPLWLFGHRKPKDLAPSFHKKRVYVRDQVFWNAIIHRLIEEQPGISLRRRIPEQACLKIEFATRFKNARDLDHYCVSPFVNSLVYNGLLLSDHPARLQYCTSWREVQKGPESVKVSVVYLTSTL